ncbi:MAG: hypothetical protein WBP44_02565 [Gammaproteobacteria bacterium]
MLSKHLVLPAVFLLSLTRMTTALAEDISSAYLVGTWGLEGKENCGVSGKEHIKLAENGKFELGRLGRVDFVGFWALEGNRLDLHMVGSPYRIDNALVQHKDQYGYAHLPVFIFNMGNNTFDAVVPEQDDVRMRSAQRCS